MVAAQNHSWTPGDPTTSNLTVVPVANDQWGIVAWLWQAYRHDLATVVNGLPYADGRYQCRELSQFPSADGAGYIAWRPHPKHRRGCTDRVRHHRRPTRTATVGCRFLGCLLYTSDAADEEDSVDLG